MSISSLVFTCYRTSVSLKENQILTDRGTGRSFKVYACGARWGLALENSEDDLAVDRTRNCYLVSSHTASDPKSNCFLVVLGFENLSEALAWFSARKTEALYSYEDIEGGGTYLDDKVGIILDKILRRLERDIGKDGLVEVLLKSSGYFEQQGAHL